MERVEYISHTWDFNSLNGSWEGHLLKSLNIEGSAGWRVVHMEIQKFYSPNVGAHVTVYMMRVSKD